MLARTTQRRYNPTVVGVPAAVPRSQVVTMPGRPLVAIAVVLLSARLAVAQTNGNPSHRPILPPDGSGADPKELVQNRLRQLRNMKHLQEILDQYTKGKGIDPELL